MSVSGISERDYALLLGHYARITNNNSISPDVYDRGYTEEQLRVLEQKHVERLKGTVVRILNLEFSGSLEQFDYPNFDYVMTLFSAYDRQGILPFQGSLAEQPAQIIDIFSILTQIQFETQVRSRKEYEAEMKKTRRANGR